MSHPLIVSPIDSSICICMMSTKQKGLLNNSKLYIICHLCHLSYIKFKVHMDYLCSYTKSQTNDSKIQCCFVYTGPKLFFFK